MTDTDSLFLHIKTENVYEDIRDEVEEFYDTSELTFNPVNLPKINRKIIGKIKDEAKGEIITEFCGNRAKSYCFKFLNEEEKLKCKGGKKK